MLGPPSMRSSKSSEPKSVSIAAWNHSSVLLHLSSKVALRNATVLLSPVAGLGRPEKFISPQEMNPWLGSR